MYLAHGTGDWELKNMVPVSGEGLHAMANHARR